MLPVVPAVKVAIFEDNRHLRESMTLVLNNSEGITCTGAFSHCNDLVRDLLRAEPDVVLMDIEMPGIDGIEATRMIRRQFPHIKVIIQTVFDANDTIFAAICAGASGYLLKNWLPGEWADTIRSVVQGGAPMSAPIAAKVLDLVRKPAAAPVRTGVALTEREQEILRLLVDGCSYKMVADRLFISFFTVQSHIKNIYEKLEVNSKSEAVTKAFREKLF